MCQEFCLGGVGVSLIACWDTPLPPGADPPEANPPPPDAVHARRYGQQASGTYPTGMHTCSKFILKTSALNATGDKGISADSVVAHWFKKDIATIAAKIILDSDF